MRASSIRVFTSLTALVATALVVSGCAGHPAAPADSTPAAHASVVAIGHSGLTGFNSDPAYYNQDVLANSWATGTNPDVDSIFLRMSETDPHLRAVNYAVDGSDVDNLLSVQAQEAVSVKPAPKLIIVQSVDNDLQCDGTDAENVERYKSKLTDVLGILTRGAPDATIFFVSQWADVRTYSNVVASITEVEGEGPCDVNDPVTHKPTEARMASMQKLTDSYFDAIAEVCATVPKCVWDGGAEQKLPLTAEDLTSDHNHMMPSGQEKMAEIAWSVIGPVVAG